ncbi:MAG: hypothetical protein VX496_06020 [Planctomycetota bacterium]|nr:hypothetical protein [Planctomycetota bacterium]
MNLETGEAGGVIPFTPVYCTDSGIFECELATVSLNTVSLNIGFWSVGWGTLADRFNIRLKNEMK